MPIFEDIMHSLFGRPQRVELPPTVDGHRVYVTQGMNVQIALVLFSSILVFLVYMWFYLSPLIRNRNIIAPYSLRDVEVHNGQSDAAIQNEHKSLLQWMRRGSRGRFADTEGKTRNTRSRFVNDQKHDKRPLFRCRCSLFSRSSVVPPVGVIQITPPPPAYVSHPNSPTPEYQFPPQRGTRTGIIPRVPPMPTSQGRFHSMRGIGPRSVSDSILRPPTGTLHMPSPAILCDRSSTTPCSWTLGHS